MTTIQRIERFFRKSPQQMWGIARFLSTMWLSKLSYTPYSLRGPPIDHLTEQITVNTISIDACLDGKQIDRVDLLKIATEGGEPEAFRGAEILLSRYRPVIICEVLDLVTHAWGYGAAEIIGLLRAHDYEWFDIVSNVDLFPHRPKKDYTEGRNYLAVPREKQERLLSRYDQRSLPHRLGQQGT